jgi:hypothetical protein
MFNFETVVEAGIKPRHVTRLLNVSRVTASNWLRGVTQPHPFIQEKAQALLDAVDAAVEDGVLPVPHQLPQDEKSVKTLSIVRSYMEQNG